MTMKRLRSMRAHRSSPAMAIVLLVGSTLTYAGASSLAVETAAASPATAPASAPCTNAAQAQAQILAEWRQAEKALGVPAVKPPPETVCYVNTAKYKKAGPYTIAFASQGPTNSWASISDAYVRYEIHQYHAKLLYASANGSGASQVGEVQELVSQKPDALIVQPLTSALQAELHLAARENIPVVVCTGQLSDTNDVTATVNRSYQLTGTLFAEWIAKKLHGKGEIAMLSGIAGAPTAEDTYTAALAVFKKYPGIKIETHQYTNWSITQAKTVAASMLVQYPHLNAIWSDSSFNDIGVAEAYSAAHKAIPPMTADASNEFLRLAKQLHISFADAAYPPEQCGQAVQVAMKILHGQSVLNDVPVSAAVFTNAQLSKYYMPNCTDSMWVPSKLPNAILRQLKLCH